MASSGIGRLHGFRGRYRAFRYREAGYGARGVQTSQSLGVRSLTGRPLATIIDKIGRGNNPSLSRPRIAAGTLAHGRGGVGP